MSIATCLARAVERGELSKADAKRIGAEYEASRRRKKAGGSPTAEVDAKNETAELLDWKAKEDKRRKRLAAIVLNRVKKDLARYRTATGREDIPEAAIALLEHFGTAPYQSVEGLRKTIIGQAQARMDAFLENFQRTKLLGKTPNRPQLENVVREAFGEDTGDAAAKAFAASWGETSEWLRQRFNRGGGNIGKRENWGMPQSHDSLKMLGATFPVWKAFIRERLDIAKMRHPGSDTPVTEGELDGVLLEVWNEIVTDGWATRAPKKAPFGRGALAKQRGEHRFLVFKDADNWLAYQERFGQGDPYAAMMQHVNLMARDVAALEILGPNPATTVEYISQQMRKGGEMAQAGVAGGPPVAPGILRTTAGRARNKERIFRAMWDTMRGAAEVPEDLRMANFGAGMRNWLTASILGSATLSAVPTDPVFAAFARHFAGIPVAKELASMTRQIAGGASRREAVRAGLILDSAMHTFGAQARYIGTLDGGGMTNWVVDRVLTFSGLTPWTQAGRHAFGMDFLGTLGEHARKRWPDLPPGLSHTLDRWGFTPKDWDAMRSAALYDPFGNGATFLRPNEVAAVDEKLAEKMLGMVLMETEYAVPSSTVRGRAAVAMPQGRAGTLWGELVGRSFGMFKSFPVTVMMLWGARMVRETAQHPAKGGAYAGALLLTTTMGGMVSEWLHDITSGRDPRPLTPAAAGAAILRGGGLGIFGDFLFNDINRYGKGLPQTLAGPIPERATELINLTVGNLVQLAAGQETDALRELIRFSEGMTPGSSLWYLRLGYQRIAMDQLEYLADPKANAAWKRQQGFWRKNFGNAYWWRPGELTPGRAPAMVPDVRMHPEGPA